MINDYLIQTEPQLKNYSFLTAFGWLKKIFLNLNINLIFIFLYFWDNKKKLKYILNISVSIFLFIMLIIIGTIARVKDWLPDQYLYTPYILILPIIGERLFILLKKNKLIFILFFLFYIVNFIKNDYFF